MHVAVGEGVCGAEHLGRLGAVAHVLLDAEVRDGQVDVQSGGMGDRDTNGPVGSGSNPIQVGESKDAL